MKEGYSDHSTFAKCRHMSAAVCVCWGRPWLFHDAAHLLAPGDICACLSWWPGLRVGDSSSGKFGNNRSSQEHYPLHPRNQLAVEGQRAPRVSITGSQGQAPGRGGVQEPGLAGAELPGAGLTAQGGWEVGGSFSVPTEQVGPAPEATQAALPTWVGGVCSGPGRSNWLPSIFLVSVTRSLGTSHPSSFVLFLSNSSSSLGNQGVGEFPQGVNSCRPPQLFLL